MDQLGSSTRPAAGGGEVKRDAADEDVALDTGSLSLLGRKAGAGEEKSSSHSKPPPVGTFGKKMSREV